MFAALEAVSLSFGPLDLRVDGFRQHIGSAARRAASSLLQMLPDGGAAFVIDATRAHHGLQSLWPLWTPAGLLGSTVTGRDSKRLGGRRGSALSGQQFSYG